MVRYRLSGTSLNLRCTSTNQSFRIALIFSLISSYLSIKPSEGIKSFSLSLKYLNMSTAYSAQD